MYLLLAAVNQHHCKSVAKTPLCRVGSKSIKQFLILAVYPFWCFIGLQNVTHHTIHSHLSRVQLQHLPPPANERSISPILCQHYPSLLLDCLIFHSGRSKTKFVCTIFLYHNIMSIILESKLNIFGPGLDIFTV